MDMEYSATIALAKRINLILYPNRVQNNSPFFWNLPTLHYGLQRVPYPLTLGFAIKSRTEGLQCLTRRLYLWPPQFEHILCLEMFESEVAR